MTDYMMKKVFNLHNLTIIKVKASLIKKNKIIDTIKNVLVTIVSAVFGFHLINLRVI